MCILKIINVGAVVVIRVSLWQRGGRQAVGWAIAHYCSGRGTRDTETRDRIIIVVDKGNDSGDK